MTAPGAGDVAPNGYKNDGSISDDLEATRSDMESAFDDATRGLTTYTDYYEASSRPDAIGLSVPPEMKKLLAYVGYPRTYVDSIAERLEITGFRLAAQPTGSGGTKGGTSKVAQAASAATSPTKAASGSDSTGADDTSATDAITAQFWDWWNANSLDTESILGHTESLVSARSYITISAPDPQWDVFNDPTVPIIRVEPPTNLYARMDPKTRQVQQAIRVVKDEDGSKTISSTLYLPNQTVFWDLDPATNELTQIRPPVVHNLGICPVVPITNRTQLKDLYGTSQITPELMSVTDAAARILMDMQGAAELMAVPQRILFGVNPEDIGVDPSTGQSKYNAYLARILAFGDEGGKAMQFAAAELRNFCDALDQLDRKAAGYTGLPPQYLSFSSQNPASADAIKASESRLVKMCERKCNIFGAAWEQAMRIASLIMNPGGGYQALDPQLFRLEAVWADPSTPTYATKADAAAKLYAQGTGVIPREQAWIDMGYTIEQRAQMRVWIEQEMQAQLDAFGVIGNSGTPGQPGSGPQSTQSQTSTGQDTPASTKAGTPTTKATTPDRT